MPRVTVWASLLLLSGLVVVPAAGASATAVTGTATAGSNGLTRVSVSAAGGQLHGRSTGVRLSSGGRYALFTSTDPTLVAHDTNGVADAFVRDRLTGQLDRVSVSSTGAQRRIPSRGADISADGRFVLFDSGPEDGPAGIASTQVYLRDRQRGTTTLVTASGVTSSGAAPPTWGIADMVTSDGRYVLYYSEGNNYRWDRVTGATLELPWAFDQDVYAAAISDDGQIVSFGGVNDDGTSNVWLADVPRQAIIPIRMPVLSAHPTWAVSAFGLTPDGRYVAVLVGRSGDVFKGRDIYIYDRVTSHSRLVVSTPGPDSIDRVALSPDASRVAFTTAAQLLPSDRDRVTDIYEWSATHGLRCVSEPLVRSGQRARSTDPSYSRDGTLLSFTSYASDLIPHDSNGTVDVFDLPSN